MFNKALLTLDGSSFSESAIARVTDVACREAVVLQVWDPVSSVGRISPSERGRIQEYLDDAAAQLRAARIEEVSTVIGEGEPGSEIVKLAAQEQCDVIVMSTHGRTGLKRTFLGSVACYVVEHAQDSAIVLTRPLDEAHSSPDAYVHGGIVREQV